MPNYSNGKIYKIVDETNDNIYIGSTTISLSQRLVQHRNNYKQYIIGNQKNVSSFNIIKNDKYCIVLIEECPCENKEQLLRKEREWIEKLECINKYRPIITEEERIIYNKEWRDSNREYIKQYYDLNKDKKLERQKQYYDLNKDKILERQKIYEELNREKISKRKKEKRLNLKLEKELEKI